jgi:A/G-specific adenine glycosylase
MTPSPSTAPPEVAVTHVTAAVIARDGLILLARRPPGALMAGRWEFPGGKQEPDESLEQCLGREIQEELGVAIEVGPRLMSLPFDRAAGPHRLHVYACRLTAGSPRPLGVDRVAWVEPARLMDYDLLDVDRQVARRLMRP